MEEEIEQPILDDGFDADAEDSEEQAEAEQASDEVEDETEGGEDESEPEFEEVEYEGEVYHVPPALKDALLRHGDYTQKTQAHAEQVKAFEEQQKVFEQERQLAAQQFQRQQANQQAYGQLQALDSQLEQYKQVNWAEATEKDPVEAQKAFFQYNQLRDQREQLAGYIQQAEQQSTQEQQAELQRKLEQGREALVRDIPNWGPELQQSITETAVEIGLSRDELSALYNPAHVKALYYAKIGYEAMKKAQTKTPAAIKPAKTIKGASKAAVNVNPEELSDSEWAKQRAKQRKRKG